jgi:beta-glucanase (GH16 family)
VASSAFTAPAAKTATAKVVKPKATTLKCGTATLHKAIGGDWTCTFDDEFSGYSLNSDKWTAMDTTTTNFSAGVECYTPSNVAVNGSSLVLTASRLRAPIQCGKSLTTQYLSGMVTTKFAQAYGRFEMRAKMPVGVGMQPAFWMLPATPYVNNSYEYGEIDVAEAWGAYPNLVSPHLHYVTTPTPMSGVNCTVPNSSGTPHTYALEWTPTQMQFIYDGTTCWTTTWEPLWPYAPSGATSPVPFDQPFYVMIELAINGSSVPSNQVTARTKMPAKMTIDYLRVWK